MTRPLSIPLLLAASLAVAGCSENREQSSATDATSSMAMNDMGSMGMAAPNPEDSPATQGYKTSMNDMMASMPPFTGDADTDFMWQMKGHHQAAIAMAEIELRHGRDPRARGLAESIIRDQRAEIAQINAWLAARE